VTEDAAVTDPCTNLLASAVVVVSIAEVQEAEMTTPPSAATVVTMEEVASPSTTTAPAAAPSSPRGAAARGKKPSI
jgi:hypothetical protein